MAYTLAQLMNMDLYELTDKNHDIGNLYIASLIQVLEACKRKGTPTSKVKFHGFTQRADGKFQVGVSYG